MTRPRHRADVGNAAWVDPTPESRWRFNTVALVWFTLGVLAVGIPALITLGVLIWNQTVTCF